MFEESNLVRGNSLTGEVDRIGEDKRDVHPGGTDFHIPDSFYKNPDFTFVLASALTLSKGAVMLSANLMRDCFEQMTDPSGNVEAVARRLRAELTQPNLYLHLLETGRFPSSGDEIPPYQYRGWLLAQIIILDITHPRGSRRWEYWAKTHLAGGVIAEEIPQIHFHGEGDSRRAPGLKHLQEMVDYIGRAEGHWAWEAFTCLMDWLGFAMNLRDEPPPRKLKEETQAWLYENFNLETFLNYPGDYIGDYICSIRSGKWNPNAFFPTPIPVVKFMVDINFQGADIFSTVLDPCLGTGRMLMLASNHSVRLYGMDIDPLMVLAAQMNFSMYAPWGVKAFPDAYFKRAAPSLPVEVDTSLDPQQWLFDDANRLKAVKKTKKNTVRPVYPISRAVQANLFDEGDDKTAEKTGDDDDRQEMGEMLEFPARKNRRRQAA